MSDDLLVIILMLGSYLFGSLPFGLWVTRAWAGVDIRRVGSGNIGATNVLRAAGWRAALVVFALDAGKGAAPVLLARALGTRLGYGQPAAAVVIIAAGLLALVGHTFSIFLRLRGGRGVATGFGVLAGISWPVGLSGLAVFVVVVLVTRIVSLASIAGALSMLPFMMLYGEARPYVVFAGVAGALVTAMHAPNIRRLLRGEEPRIGGKGPKHSDE